MAQILRKQLKPNIEIVVVHGHTITFNLVMTGVDELRPTDVKTVTSVPPETIRLLLEHEWEPVAPSQK